MCFNLKRADQASSHIHNAEAKVHAYFGAQLTKGGAPHVFTRLAGFPIGIAIFWMQTAARVAKLGESVLKGISNLCGAPFSSQCNAIKGAKQLLINSAANTLSLLLIPLDFFVKPIIFTILYLVFPKTTTDTLEQPKSDPDISTDPTE